MTIEQFPHCDQRILHAPGECEYCDMHPEWQELRKSWGIAFTGHEPAKDDLAAELPCPADFNRGDKHKKWGGNVAVPKNEVSVLPSEITPVTKDYPVPKASTDGVTPGFEEASAPGPVGPSGQHVSYWVLSEEERAKGFVRPVRHSYKHVGPPPPKYALRPLTEDEQQRYSYFNYVSFEVYPESESPVTGRYWTQKDLDDVNKGCGMVTTMSSSIAETYARNPKFYGSTFCVGCHTHLPVGPQGEFTWVDDKNKDTNERVGT